VADSTIATTDGVAAEQFMDSVFKEYRDKLVTRPYMGLTSEFPIQVNQELAKVKGDAITFNLAGALSGAGVTGASTLEGSEEAQSYYAHRVVVDQKRNAVRIPWMSEQRAPFALMQEAKPALTTWLAQVVEDDIFKALSTINGVVYGSATEGQKDAWAADNADRILYGAATSNNSSNDNSASLANIDGTNDIFNVEQISLAKRLAMLCNPKIRPIRIQNGEEFFVMFAHPYCVRDLKNTTAWQAAQRDAMPRGTDNPIFTGMAGIWDGVIIKETPKVLLLSGVGASSINVAMNSLCGAQALLFAQAGTPKGFVTDLVEEEFDYGDKTGVAIRSVYGIEKARFQTNATNACQHGVVSVFSAAVAD
jgi:N4-gp56 family major capsid protein